jgi:hypothetical protein
MGKEQDKYPNGLFSPFRQPFFVPSLPPPPFLPARFLAGRGVASGFLTLRTQGDWRAAKAYDSHGCYINRAKLINARAVINVGFIASVMQAEGRRVKQNGRTGLPVNNK